MTVYDWIKEAHGHGAKFWACPANLELFDKSEADLIGTTDKDFQEISSETALQQAVTNLHNAIGASGAEVAHDPLPG